MLSQYGEFSPFPPLLPWMGPLGWDLDLEAKIWASRPPGLQGTEKKEEKEEKKEKNPHICESIGHRPLWGRYPKMKKEKKKKA